MKKGFLVLAAVLISAAVVGGAVAAGPGWYGGWRGMGPGMMGYAGPGWCWAQPYGAALSSEQQAKLDQLRRKYWEETQGLREQLFQKRQELWRLYGQPTPDQEAVSKLQKEVFDLRQKLWEKHWAFQKEASEIVPGFQGPYGYGFGWGWHHMGPGWGHQMMGPYAGGPCWGY
jgi:Spy/CpxP family protein refolding chaperone